MKIPKSIKIWQCVVCTSALTEKCFRRCGTTLTSHPAGVFFDYDCPACNHHGSYAIHVKDGYDAPEILRKLADLLEMEEKAEKGNIKTRLNSINSVDDLLKIGEKDAPREH